MSASERRFEFGTVAACAALGSILAGGTLGTLIASSYVKYSDGLWQALSMIIGLAIGGAIFALVFGGTIGFAVGFLVSRYVGTGIGHAALTGAVTGMCYPLLFFVTGLLLDSNGLSQLAGSFAMFVGLGAICGALAHWLVVGRASARRG